MSNFRETTIRVYGVERIIRTERKGSAKALDAEHTKAVKAALEQMHTEETDRLHAEDMACLERKEWADADGFGGSGARAKASALEHAKQAHAKRRGRKFAFPKCNYVDARKGWPKIRFTDEAPTYLVEHAPGEYATEDAADSMGVTALVDEAIPGLAVVPGPKGRGWMLGHVGSRSSALPNGMRVGPVVPTRARARQMAVDDLSRVDWTRSVDDLRSDPVAGPLSRLLEAQEAARKRPADMAAQAMLSATEEALQRAAA